MGNSEKIVVKKVKTSAELREKKEMVNLKKMREQNLDHISIFRKKKKLKQQKVLPMLRWHLHMRKSTILTP